MGEQHTPYVCLEQMNVEAAPNAWTEIPAIIRNLDSCGCPPSVLELGPGWHPPNGKPWMAHSLPVKRTVLRDLNGRGFAAVKLEAGGLVRAKFCIQLGDVTAPGYVTPVITIRRRDAKGGIPSVHFFEWEGSVVYSGGMTEEEASFHLYPTGPLR